MLAHSSSSWLSGCQDLPCWLTVAQGPPCLLMVAHLVFILFSFCFALFGDLASEHRAWGRALNNVILMSFVLKKSHLGLLSSFGVKPS